jgi:hypothetical protein
VRGEALQQWAGGGYLPGRGRNRGAEMAAGARLIAALVMGVLAFPAVTACGLLGDSSSPCFIASKFNVLEMKITGPKVHGCDASVHTEVSAWEFLGLGEGFQYGTPPPTGAPACTVSSGDQTWSVWESAKGVNSTCYLLGTKEGLGFWQAGERQAGN